MLCYVHAQIFEDISISVLLSNGSDPYDRITVEICVRDYALAPFTWRGQMQYSIYGFYFLVTYLKISSP